MVKEYEKRALFLPDNLYIYKIYLYGRCDFGWFINYVNKFPFEQNIFIYMLGTTKKIEF